VFKFVLETKDDLDEAHALVLTFGVPPSAVWGMPLGATKVEHLANLAMLADPIIDRGWNLTTRLHILAWGTERAR